MYTKATCLRKAFRWLPVARHRIGNTVNSVSFLLRQSSLYKHGESWLRKIDRVVEKFYANGFVHGDLRLSNITVSCTTVYGSPRSHARNGTKFRLGAPVLTCSSQCSSFFFLSSPASSLQYCGYCLVFGNKHPSSCDSRRSNIPAPIPTPMLPLSPFLFSTPLVSSHALGQHLTTQAATTR